MKIDLGQKTDPGCCAPMGSSDNKDKTHYPSLYFTHDEPVEVPEEGTAVIKFRRIESSENTRDPNDPKYRCEIEVHSIEFKGGSSKGEINVGSMLKDNLRKRLKKGDYSEDSDE